MKTSTIVTLVIVGLLALIGLGTYNGLITSDEKVTQKFADVETTLQRRYDLIPNLVATVQGYAKHEKDVFVAVTEARSQWGKATTQEDKVEASNRMESALARLLVVSENYPQLKANTSFTQLQDELAGTENRIAVARKDYNEAVNVHNTKVRTLPGKFFTGIAGVSTRKEFKASEAAQTAPQVKF